MKIHSFAVWWCLLLTGLAEAQVANDDCAGAIALGVTYLPTSWHCNPLQGGSGFSPPIIDSTDQALVNFPYPTNPNACLGHTNAISAPSRDVWYAVRVTCDLLFEIECSDSCQVSVWVGGDCTTLYPGYCFTALPGIPMFGFAQGLAPPQDTILLQISAMNSAVDLGYTLCMTNQTPPCTPTPSNWTEPTPVLCFEASLSINSCTAPGAMDGGVQVNVLDGNGPWSILWMDGDTGFTRTGLGEGAYIYTITDAIGCFATDTAHIGVNAPLSTIVTEEPTGFAVWQNSGMIVIQTNNPLFAGQAFFMDSLGRILTQQEIIGGRAIFGNVGFPAGVYFVQLVSPESITTSRCIRMSE